MFNLIDYLNRQIPFSRKTFGEGNRTLGICDHIQKELQEIKQAPTDLEEWIDIIILGLDGAWRTGATPEQICAALEAKLAKNMSRKWPAPTDQDHAIEHIRDESWMPDGAHNH